MGLRSYTFLLIVFYKKDLITEQNQTVDECIAKASSVFLLKITKNVTELSISKFL